MKGKKISGKDDDLKYKILKELYFDKSLSCASLSKRTKKSIPIVTKAMSELMQDGYVTEKGFAPSSGGRRPMMYALHSDRKYVMAVAMDQLYVQMVLFDLRNNAVVGPETQNLALTNDPSAADDLSKLISSFIERSGIDPAQILGVGIGMPGFVDVKKGVNHSFLQTDGSLRDKLSADLKLPVFIDNDSSLIALAELRFGEARNKHNVMVVNFGWGIGLGMALEGKLFRGHSGFAGEFSHMPTAEGNDLCGCGKQGCLETEASLLVVIRKAIEGLNNGIKSSLQVDVLSGTFDAACDAVLNAALYGDQFAISLLSDAAAAIGKGLAVLIHIMNPETIVISGRGSRIGKLLLAPLQQSIHRYSIPKLASSTELKLSSLGREAELLGAAALVIESIVNERQASDLPVFRKSA